MQPSAHPLRAAIIVTIAVPQVFHKGTEDRYVLYMSVWKAEFGKLTKNRRKKFWV